MFKLIDFLLKNINTILVLFMFTILPIVLFVILMIVINGNINNGYVSIIISLAIIIFLNINAISFILLKKLNKIIKILTYEE